MRLLAALLLLLAPTPLSTPTPEDLLAGAIQSIGGRAALERIESLHLHGVMRLPSGRPAMEVELSTARGGKVLAVQTFVGVGQLVYGSDGTTAWERTTSAGGSESHALITHTVLATRVRQINWLEWLTTLPRFTSELEVVGEARFDGQECWQMRAVHPNGRDEQVFFSRTTRRPVGRRTLEPTGSGEGATIDVYFRDWQPAGDLLLFRRVTFDRGGTAVELIIDRIDLDGVPATRFELPAAILRLKDAP